MILIGGTDPAASNLVSGNAGAGIELVGPGSSGDLVQGNDIGTNAAGRAALANGIGVLLNAAPANVLGGTVSSAGNLIAGNASAGVQIFGVGASNNVLMGNRIGLDATGAVPLGNGVGVFIDDVGPETIGGLAPGSGNVISGNATAGVYILGRNATGNLVVGNVIGPDPSGNTSIVNAGSTNPPVASQAVGVLISDTVGNTVGGTSAAARNVVSGNLVGVEIAGNDTELPALPNVVAGNFIGTTASGQAALGNGVGIYVNDASNNLIGGMTPGARNVISGNTSYGVFLFGTLTKKNAIQGNYLGVAADGRTTFRVPGGSFLQQVGVAFENASQNTVGGLLSGAGNVLTGNDQAGVYIFGQANSSQGNIIQRNLIGTNADGSRGAGNRQYGVLLFNAPTTSSTSRRAAATGSPTTGSPMSVSSRVRLTPAARPGRRASGRRGMSPGRLRTRSRGGRSTLTRRGPVRPAAERSEVQVEQEKRFVRERFGTGHGVDETERQHAPAIELEVHPKGQVHHVVRPCRIGRVQRVAVGKRRIDVGLERGRNRCQEAAGIRVAEQVVADPDVVVDHRNITGDRGHVQGRETLEIEVAVVPDIAQERLD